MTGDIVNYEAILNKVKRLRIDSPNTRKEILQKTSEHFLKLVNQYAPRDSGKYAKSWKIISIDDKQAVIGSNMFVLYAVLEFGVDHEVKITPKDPNGVLHWIDKDTGEDVFVKFAIIPPRKAQPHIRRAKKDTLNHIPQIVRYVLAQKVKDFS